MSPLVGLVAATVLAAAPPAGLAVRIDPPVASVGDLVVVELALDVPAGKTPVFPRWSESWGAAEIRAVDPLERRRRARGETVRQRLTVAFLRPGSHELPSPEVSLVDAGGEHRVEIDSPITVEIRSVLPAEGEPVEPQPALPPVPLPRWTRAFLVTTSLLTLACAIAMALLIRRRRAEATLAAAPPDPLADLRAALRALEREGSMAARFTGLSLALRRFLGATLEFPAAESTTTEIRRHLGKVAVPHDLRTAIDAVLRECDAVKFARRAPRGEHLADVCAQVEELASSLLAFLAPMSSETGEEIAA